MIPLSEAKKLYERFYEGTATHGEAEQLARYILSDDCPDEWRAEMGVFAAIIGETFTLPQGFTERMASHLQSVTGDGRKAVSLWIRFRKVAAAAVAVAACIALAIILWPSTEPSPVTEDITPVATRSTASRTAQPVAVQAKKASSDTICLPTSPKRQRLNTSSAALAKTEEKTEENKSQQATAPTTSSFYAATAHSEDEAKAQLAKAAALLEEARRESRQTIQTLSLDDCQFPSAASPTLTNLTIN